MDIDRKLVSRALVKIGEEPLVQADIDNNSAKWRYVKELYLPTIRESLSATEWTSQIRRKALERAVDMGTPDSYYAFILPEDCCKPLSLASRQDWDVEGRTLYTDDGEAELVYVSDSYSGNVRYTPADPQPTSETFAGGEYYVQDAEGNFERADEYVDETEFYVILQEDLPGYDGLIPDPLFEEYIATRLAAELALKMSGEVQLYQLLYSEAAIMERRAAQLSIAHAHNKDKGNPYWGDVLGLPSYGDTSNAHN